MIEVDNKNTYTVSTSTGLLAGMGAGVVAGAKASNKVIQDKTPDLIKGLTKDQYVSQRLEANMDKIHSSMRQSKWKKAFSDVAEKAKADYDKMAEAVAKKAKSTKIKWIAGLAAAGLALGAGAALVSSKAKSEK